MAQLTEEQKADIEAVDKLAADAPDDDDSSDDAEEGESGDSDEDAEDEESDLSDAEIAEARNLYKALKDPTTRSLVLTDLAQKAGITSDSSKKEVKEAKRNIQNVLEEMLGKEYDFMIPKLSKALETIFEQERSERAADRQSVEARLVQRDVDSALGRLSRETKGESKRLEARMVQVMNQFPAAPDTDIYTYLHGIYSIASAGRATRAATAQVTDKIKKNSKDAFARLPSARGREDSGKPPNKKLNLNQSIKWAMDQLANK
jgi:hypothetical protein